MSGIIEFVQFCTSHGSLQSDIMNVVNGFDATMPNKIMSILEEQMGTYDLAQQEEWAKKQGEIKKTPLYLAYENTNFVLVREILGFELTPAISKYLDDNFNVFLGQRIRTRRRSTVLATSILSKTWIGNKIVIAILGEDYITQKGIKTRLLLVNGGHTIGVSMEFGLLVPNNLVQFVYCPTVKDAADLYMAFDRPESSRSSTEQAKAVVAGRDDWASWIDKSDGHVQSRVFKNCQTAAMVAHFGPRYRQQKLTEKEKNNISLEFYDKEMYWLKSFVYNDASTPPYLKKVVGVFGPMMQSHIAWGDVCTLFWNDVKAGYDGSPRMNVGKKRSPQSALVQYLVSLEGPGTKEDELTVHGKVMTAMNAWAEGKEFFSFKGRRLGGAGKSAAGWDLKPIDMKYFNPHPKNLPNEAEAA